MSTSTTTKNGKRNSNVSKWNILFEREGKQWMSVRPQEGTEVYTCYACRELFGCKSSFLDHVNRFTIVLHFKCDACTDSEEMPFYNPCSLLLHSRGHYSPFSGQIDLDNIKVSCLPFGLVGFPPHPNIPMYYNIREESSNAVNVNTRFYAPVRANKGKNIISMIPTILLFYHYKLNGTPPASLVLKQICINVPKCVFVRLENNTLTANVVTTSIANKKVMEQESTTLNDSTERIENTLNIQCNVNPCIHENVGNASIVNENLDIQDSESRNNNNTIVKEITEGIAKNKHINIQQSTTIKEEVVDNDGTSNELSAIEASNQTNENIVPNLAIVKGIICPECKTTLPNKKLLSSHFVSIAPLNDAFQCNICKYIAATPCSLTAHKRLHNRQPPFICPECGGDFLDNISLLDHLEDVCFHLAKQVRLRCPKKNCCKVFAQASTFMTHFEVHIQTLNKCTICGATYYALRDFVEHGHTVHEQIVPVELIYKCTICKISALEVENYREHVNWHCKDKSLRVYVYICKFCRNFFRSGLTYANHLMRCSKKELTIEELRRLKKCNAAVVCLHCNYVVRLMTNLPDCPRCGMLIDTTSATPTSGRNIAPAIEKNTNITMTSQNNNINNNSNNNNINNNDKINNNNIAVSSNSKSNENNLRLIKCILCYKDLIVSHAHLHECRYKYPQVVLMREEERIQNIINMKRETPDPINSRIESYSKKKRRKISISPSFIKHKRSSDVELRLDKPVPFEGTYTCKICNYTDSDRTSFHQHIRDHRNISTAYQCMECGECFVVKPSFHKHLMYYHRISNVDEYVRENECVDQGAISELRKHMRLESGEVNDDVEENQCKVCLKQFEDSLELNKHFRIHGMAFLRNNK
ncbi:hypothetical protein AMK59_6687 [Oryctes borbonicus]|uniref:C2H2-type domain-containing protein n=1 Tax=Oryctes borbonicus TaxID=1629725 RepID=A0A0T6AU81_9SCAR|nr:hypothetical protein AMK59_6687 [Oryctes borbonicus]